MTLIRFIPLDKVKPPRDIFRRGATARSAAGIEKPMTFAETFQNRPLFSLAPVLFGYVALQDTHPDTAVVGGYPLSLIGILVLMVAKVFPETLLRIARATHIADFVIAFQMQTVNIKHKTLLLCNHRSAVVDYSRDRRLYRLSPRRRVLAHRFGISVSPNYSITGVGHKSMSITGCPAPGLELAI